MLEPVYFRKRILLLTWLIGALAITQTVTTMTQVNTLRTGSATVTSIAASASVVTLAVENRGRLGLTIFNDSIEILRIKLGANASATSYTRQMGARSYYEIPFGYTGIVTGIWDVGSGSAKVTEI